MSAVGKARRLSRIVESDDGRAVILPLDLAVPLGPVDGASDQRPLVEMANAAGVDAVLLRWGEARHLVGGLSPNVGLIVRLSGTAFTGDDAPDGLFHTVEASLEIGADAVCVDLKLGHPDELQAMRDVARVCEACDRLGIACLVEAVVLGDGAEGGEGGQQFTAAVARVAQELGADMVKVAHPGTVGGVEAVVRECQRPIVVAGGEPIATSDILAGIGIALEGGAAGTAIGRNVITSRDPAATQRAIVSIVHGGQTVAAATASLNESLLAPAEK